GLASARSCDVPGVSLSLSRALSVSLAHYGQYIKPETACERRGPEWENMLGSVLGFETKEEKTVG
ncbi:hypothetical protein GWI33_000581, partial [Rhynchophorus ferrugineus]